MAKNDIKIRDVGGHNVVPTYRWQVDDRDTSSESAMEAGEPLKGGTAAGGSPFAIKCVDADHTLETDAAMLGITQNDSTETATVNGVVDVYMPLPGVIYECNVTTTANFDTQSEIDALAGDYLQLDVTSDVFTIDENVGNTITNAYLLIGGDPNTQVAHFMIKVTNTVLGASDVA